MIAINLIVVSKDEWMYEKVMKELSEEHLYPDVIHTGSIRETMAVLGRGPSRVVEIEGSGDVGKAVEPLPGADNYGFELPMPKKGNQEEELQYIRMYVRLHLHEDLTLARIAEQIGFTSIYLCSFFR